MKINKILAASLIAALGFTACAKDGGENTGNDNKGVAEVVISFGDKQFTRAEGTTDGTEGPANATESEVNVIEFFTFDGSTPDQVTPYFRKTTETKSTTRFLVKEGTKNFLVAVNANLFSDATYAAASAADVTYDKIKAKIATLTLDSSNSQTAPATGTGFVMAAEATKDVLVNQANQLSMTLNRVLSKIYAPTVSAPFDVNVVEKDLGYLKELFGDTEVTEVANVTGLAWFFDGYVVINGISNSYNFRFVNWTGWNAPDGANWNNTTYTDTEGTQIATVYAGSTAADKFIVPPATPEEGTPVFIYENKPAENAKAPNEPITYNRNQVVSFLIKGHFTATVNGTAGTQSDPRYWRVNLLKDDVWATYRNSVYKVNMTSVTNPGYATPKNAEEEEVIVNPNETSIAIDLIIADWDVRTDDIEL